MGYEKLKKPPIPSAANYWINLFCVVIFFALLFGVKKIIPQINPLNLTLVCLFAAVIPLWLTDIIAYKVHQRPSANLKKIPDNLDFPRFITKLLGLFGTMAIVLVVYVLINRMFPTSILNTFFDVLLKLGPVILIGILLYFHYVDRRQSDPYDEYWQMGCLLSGRLRDVEWIVIQEHLRVWFIKGFFTPFVFAILVKYNSILLSANWTNVSFFLVFTFIMNLFYAIDVMYGVLGYILTCRLFDTHIRSTDPTILGWLVCLMCYGPFYTHFGIGLLNYDDGFGWNLWLIFQPISYHCIGIIIILLTLVYTLATVAIGYRMSNLTYRGIITTGPYRFTKHPAYLGKVASWWLISLPFFSTEGPQMALKHSAALLFISIIYFLRAKTEENHLSNYPEYVEYANWMNKHGIFSAITKRFPRLGYSEERAKSWKSVVWFKKTRQASVQ